MKKIIFLLSLFAAINTAGAQKWADKVNPWNGRNGTFFSIGYLKALESSIEYTVTSYPKTEPGFGGMAGFYCYNVGLASTFFDNEFFIGPRVTFQKTIFILTARAELDYQTTLSRDFFKISPQAGVSVFGFCSIVAGYNIFINERKIDKLNFPYSLKAQITLLN